MEPRVSYLVGRLDRVLRRRLADALAPHGLSLPEYTTLTVIRGTSGLSNAQLARRSLITPQAMSEVVARLEARRLVRRRADPSHGRVRPAELTRAGERLVRAADESVESIEQRLLDGIAPSGRSRLRDLLVAALRGAELVSGHLIIAAKERRMSSWETVRVDIDDGIAWVELNRPEKRNAMNPTLNREMVEILLALDLDDACGLVVLTGAGDAFSAGMDLKEYFREVDAQPEHVQRRVRRDANYWQWRLLRTYAKPTIAMVNGWCFGGAFTPLCACDLAIAADEATFGLSEINWGIPPGSLVSRGLAETVGTRDALLYIMTGKTFDGPTAANMRLVNWSVPRARLRDDVASLARELLEKNPVVLRAAKLGFKHAQTMSWDTAEDYLYAKLEQSQFLDTERGREHGLAQFLDEKSIRPGLQTYRRDT